MTERRRDPRVRRDGRCAQCGGKRLTRLPKVITQRSKTELLIHLNADPFCCAVCCRAYHGAPIPDKSIWGLDPEPLGAPA